MFVANSGTNLRLHSALGYHDPVYSPDGSAEGPQVALPVNTSTDITFMPLFVTIGFLLFLLAKS